jgi:hypothetical protein
MNRFSKILNQTSWNESFLVPKTKFLRRQAKRVWIKHRVHVPVFRAIWNYLPIILREWFRTLNNRPSDHPEIWNTLSITPKHLLGRVRGIRIRIKPFPDVLDEVVTLWIENLTVIGSTGSNRCVEDSNANCHHVPDFEAQAHWLRSSESNSTHRRFWDHVRAVSEALWPFVWNS